MKRYLLLASKFLVSGVLIWLLLAGADLAAIQARLQQVRPGMLGTAAAILTACYVVYGLRWRSVLCSIGTVLPAFVVLRLMYIGIFFYQTLPASVGGDVVRTYLAYRNGATLRGAVNGIMLEKAAVFVALVLLFALSLLFSPLPLDAPAESWMAPAAAILLIASACGIGFLAILDRIPDSYRRWTAVRALTNLAADTRVLFFSPRRAAAAIGWSMAGHALAALALFMLAQGLAIDVTLAECLALFLPVILLAALPISIAGWGVREGGMVYAFALIGVPAADALALSVLFGLVDMILSLPGGLVWIAGGGRMKDIQGQVFADTAGGELSKRS